MLVALESSDTVVIVAFLLTLVVIFVALAQVMRTTFWRAVGAWCATLIPAFVLYRPRRWDLIVFRFPEDPTTVYVKRLVGMPGETITIRNGAVFANGTQPAPPVDAGPLHYLAKMENWHGRNSLWGSADRPAALASDEYFVLGDFSAASNDSRLWEVGAPGHPSYAVPTDHIVGVVTHIYWPPSRWRAFR